MSQETLWTKTINGKVQTRTATSPSDEVSYKFDGWRREEEQPAPEQPPTADQPAQTTPAATPSAPSAAYVEPTVAEAPLTTEIGGGSDQAATDNAGQTESGQTESGQAESGQAPAQ
jgi:hypothetical protein